MVNSRSIPVAWSLIRPPGRVPSLLNVISKEEPWSVRIETVTVFSVSTAEVCGASTPASTGLRAWRKRPHLGIVMLATNVFRIPLPKRIFRIFGQKRHGPDVHEAVGVDVAVRLRQAAESFENTCMWFILCGAGSRLRHCGSCAIARRSEGARPESGGESW